jgi:hypothetical protein
LTPLGAVGVAPTLRSPRNADALSTLLIVRAIGVALALVRDGATLAVSTVEALGAIGVRLALLLGRLTRAVDAALVARAIAVAPTAPRGDALLVAARLTRGALIVGVALRRRLTARRKAPFAVGTVRVEPTLRRRRAGAEPTDTIAGTIVVGPALRGGQGQTRSIDASSSLRTVGIALTPVGYLADVVDALGRSGTVAILLTGQRRSTSVGRTLPGGRTIRARVACHRHTAIEIAAFALGTVRIDLTIGARLTEAAVANGPRRAVGIDLTLLELDASIVQTTLPLRTIRIGTALGLGLTRPRDGLALLATRAIRVVLASVLAATEVVATDFARSTIGVALAVAALDTAPADTDLVASRTVGIGHAPRHAALALVVDTSIVRRAIAVALALSDGLALAALADAVRGTGDVVAEIDALAAEVLTDFVRLAVVVDTAVALEEARPVDTAFGRSAIGVALALTGGDALTGVADLVAGTIGIALAGVVGYALIVATDLAVAAVGIALALGRLATRPHDTGLAVGTLSGGTALVRHADALLAGLVRPAAVVITLAGAVHASIGSTSTAATAIVVGLALGRATGIAATDLVVAAIGVALTLWTAAIGDASIAGLFAVGIHSASARTLSVLTDLIVPAIAIDRAIGQVSTRRVSTRLVVRTVRGVSTVVLGTAGVLDTLAVALALNVSPTFRRGVRPDVRLGIGVGSRIGRRRIRRGIGGGGRRGRTTDAAATDAPALTLRGGLARLRLRAILPDASSLPLAVAVDPAAFAESRSPAPECEPSHREPEQQGDHPVSSRVHGRRSRGRMCRRSRVETHPNRPSELRQNETTPKAVGDADARRLVLLQSLARSDGMGTPQRRSRRDDRRRRGSLSRHGEHLQAHTPRRAPAPDRRLR